MSRHWHRARLAGHAVDVRLNVCPGETFESLEEWWLAQERSRPKAQVSTILASRVPASVADAWVAASGIDPDTTLAHLSKTDRRRLSHALARHSARCRGQPWLLVRRGHLGWHPARRNRSGDHAVACVSRVVPRWRDPRHRWASGRVQLSMGVVFRLGRRPCDCQGESRMNEPSVWLTSHRHLLPASGDALDLACGSGRHAIWLAGQGFRTLAVDRDASAIDALNQEATRRGSLDSRQARGS